MTAFGQVRETPRDTYVHRVSSVCRDEYERTFRFLPCATALTESPTADAASVRSLCVALGNTNEEILECATLAKDLNFAQVLAPESIIRKRFGSSAVDQAHRILPRILDVLAGFVPPEGRVIAPTFPTGVPPPPVAPPAVPRVPPAPVPPAPPAPPRDIGAEILEGLAALPLTPLERTTFVKAAQECLREAKVDPPVQDAIISTIVNLEKVHVGGEADKLDEMCHQIADARKKVKPDLVPQLERVERCLCPRGSMHKSLLQTLADPGFEDLLAAGLLAATLIPVVPPL